MRLHRHAVLLAAFIAFPNGAAAQAYPTKPIRLISAASLGSTGDVALRLMTPKMSEALGQQIVVDTRSGAGGSLAAVPVMRAPPDGYNILYATPNVLVLGRFVTLNQPFDATKDFAPIALTIGFPLYLVATASVPVSTVNELIAYARKNPGKLAYGSTGVGAPPYMLLESFRILTGIDILHVPYSASGAARTLFQDLVAGRVQLYTLSYTPIKPFVGGDKLRILAVMDSTRSKNLPDVPAVTESLPNYQPVPAYYGLMGPPGLPRPIVDRLNAEARQALAAPEVATKLVDLGMHVIGSSPEGMAARLQSDVVGVGKIAKEVGLKPQ